jgi:hypothetical protein
LIEGEQHLAAPLARAGVLERPAVVVKAVGAGQPAANIGPKLPMGKIMPRVPE